MVSGKPKGKQKPPTAKGWTCSYQVQGKPLCRAHFAYFQKEGMRK